MRLHVKMAFVRTFWFCVLVFLIEKCVEADEEIEGILKFVEDGYGHISFPSSHKDFILVIGETGVGKTPFTKWMTIDNSRLISKEDEDGLFLMADDDGKIGSTQTESETLYPELYVTNDSIVYYDYAGFHDTRGTKYELGITYFNKLVVDKAQRIKILVLVDFDSVKKGGSRSRFINTMTDVSSFVKNFNKFQNSTALIVTKVPKYINDRQLSDEKVIEIIRTTITNMNNEQKENHEIEHAREIQVIDILLNRIGIFRYPNVSGPFNEIEILRPGKTHITDLINNKLIFMNTTESDFGYSISEESKNFFHKLLNRFVNTDLTLDVSNMCNEIKAEYFEQLKTIKNMTLLNEVISTGCTTLKTIQYADPRTFVLKLLQFVSKLNIRNKTTVNDLTNHLNYMEFLLKVENSSLTTPPVFITNVTNISDEISKAYENHVNAAIEKLLDDDFPKDSEIICGEIEIFYLQLEKDLADIDDIYENLQKISTKLKTLKSDEPSRFFKELIHVINELEIGISPTILTTVMVHENQLKFLNSVVNKTESSSKNTKKILDALLMKIDGSKEWYNFLITLFNPNIVITGAAAKQIDRDCAGDGSKNVSELDLQRFIGSDFKNQLDNIKDLQLNPVELTTLKKALTVLTNGADITCPDGEIMVVKGMSIKISEVIRHECWQNAKSIEIFALRSINIDAVIDKTGQKAQLTIISPIWYISGEQKILLNGQNGFGESQQAKDGEKLSERGKDGVSGKPGGPGGNFFGVGEIFIDRHQLKIELNGGRGGNGQNGGNGGPGKDGEEPPILNCGFIKYNCASDAWGGKFEYKEENSLGLGQGWSGRRGLFYIVKGKLADKPGSGGNGGKAGAGGFVGNFKLIELDQPSFLSISNKTGKLSIL